MAKPKSLELVWRPSVTGSALMDRKDSSLAFVWKGTDGGFWWQLAKGDTRLRGPLADDFAARGEAEAFIRAAIEAREAKLAADKEAKKKAAAEKAGMR